MDILFKKRYCVHNCVNFPYVQEIHPGIPVQLQVKRIAVSSVHKTDSKSQATRTPGQNKKSSPTVLYHKEKIRRPLNSHDFTVTLALISPYTIHFFRILPVSPHTLRYLKSHGFRHAIKRGRGVQYTRVSQAKPITPKISVPQR